VIKNATVRRILTTASEAVVKVACAVKRVVALIVGAVKRILWEQPAPVSGLPYTFPGNFDGAEWTLDPGVTAVGDILTGTGYATLTLPAVVVGNTYNQSMSCTHTWLKEGSEYTFFEGLEGAPVAALPPPFALPPYGTSVEVQATRSFVRIPVTPWNSYQLLSLSITEL